MSELSQSNTLGDIIYNYTRSRVLYNNDIVGTFVCRHKNCTDSIVHLVPCGAYGIKSDYVLVKLLFRKIYCQKSKIIAAVT